MTPSLRGQGEGTLGVGGETVAPPRPEHAAVSSNRCRRVPNRVHRSLTRAHDSISSFAELGKTHRSGFLRRKQLGIATVVGTDDSPSIRANAEERCRTARLQNQWNTGRQRARFSRRGRGRFEIRHAGLSTAGRPRSTVGRAHRPGWSTDRVARRSARYQTPKRQSVSAVSLTASALFERRADRAAPERVGPIFLSSRNVGLGSKAAGVKNDGTFPPANARTYRPEEGNDDET
jgi:hypothetical protein